MANLTVIVANPTAAAVTVNTKTAAARTVSKIVLDDATIADWPGWMNAGCALVGYSPAAATQRNRRQAGFLLARLQGLYP